MFFFIRPQNLFFLVCFPHSTCNHSKHALLSIPKIPFLSAPIRLPFLAAALVPTEISPSSQTQLDQILPTFFFVVFSFLANRLQMSKMSDFLFISSRFEASLWHVELLTMRYMRMINAIKSETLDKHARSLGHHVAVPISRQRVLLLSQNEIKWGLKSAFWVGVQTRCVCIQRLAQLHYQLEWR